LESVKAHDIVMDRALNGRYQEFENQNRQQGKIKRLRQDFKKSQSPDAPKLQSIVKKSIHAFE
jgi:hypothetical protein